MKVSVIIPNYNYGHLVNQAILSALCQTVKPYEIIVVDDCSIKYNMEFENAVNTLPVKVIRHKINKGGGASRNTGIKYSSGDYILLLDADDYLHPTYIEKSIGKGDIVSGWIEYAGTKTGIRKFKETPVYTDFLERNQIVNTTIFKRSVWVDVKVVNCFQICIFIQHSQDVASGCFLTWEITSISSTPFSSSKVPI